jgi:hypothetical protein
MDAARELAGTAGRTRRRRLAGFCAAGPEGDACAMLFHEHIEGLDLTAAELRGYLFELETERALAVETGVAEVGAYMLDLEEELELSRRLYVTAAVTEIATLRAELSGPQSG